jgi:hypothetical protein
MASLIPHLVVGEKVFDHTRWFSDYDYGAFLLGCMLVDVHCCSSLEREVTHFAKRSGDNGQRSFDKSCRNFIDILDDLLFQPWDSMLSSEQAFVAGYLCHLAADEEWKRLDWEINAELGLNWWLDLGIPVEVILTVFDSLSIKHFENPARIMEALGDVSIPKIFRHVPYDILVKAWDIIEILAREGGTTETYCEMLKRSGKQEEEIEIAFHHHDIYWDKARAFVCDFLGGVEPRIISMTEHALQQMPMLLTKYPDSVGPLSAGQGISESSGIK